MTLQQRRSADAIFFSVVRPLSKSFECCAKVLKCYLISYGECLLFIIINTSLKFGKQRIFLAVVETGEGFSFFSNTRKQTPTMKLAQANNHDLNNPVTHDKRAVKA